MSKTQFLYHKLAESTITMSDTSADTWTLPTTGAEHTTPAGKGPAIFTGARDLGRRRRWSGRDMSCRRSRSQTMRRGSASWKWTSLATTLIIGTSVLLLVALEGCDGQLRLGKAVNLFTRYGYLSISMKVISHNDSEMWLFKEPTNNIFKVRTVLRLPTPPLSRRTIVNITANVIESLSVHLCRT